MNKFKGTGVALITPFNEDGKVDFSGLQKLVDFQIKNDTNYLVVQGTTAESATLSEEEKKAIIEYILEINSKRIPVVLGVGGNNTKEVAKKIDFFSSYKIDGFLSVSPYYNKPTQMGLIEHYKVISSATDLPILLYNVPGRTSSNISSVTTLKLANEISNLSLIHI